MRYLKILIVLAWAGICGPASLCAQSNPPFQNPSLDSNCYFPQIGDLSEMDTIVGSDSNQDLGGTGIKNMGPKPDGSYGNIFIGNLSPIVALAQVETGPNFNLHQLKASAQKLPTTGTNRISIDFCTFGHFRDQAHIDMFNGWDGIYWADDNGNYDSSRFTFLGNNISGNKSSIGIIDAFAGYFSSDTVEDIIDGCWIDNTKDTTCLEIFKGGAALYEKDTVYEDTSCQLYPNLKNFPYRQVLTGHFRGTPWTDVIIGGESDFGTPGSNQGDFFFYANNPPFSLEDLAQAINYDTILAGWQDQFGPFGGALPTFAMPVFPKKANDHSVDFIVKASTDSLKTSLFMFRGGSDFGSHRLTLDSAAFVITNPFNSNYLWPYSITDAGDMTGTGNHVLYTAGGYDVDDQTDNFYVMGQALDDKIDIWNVSVAGSQGDTLTANNDSLEDFLLSRARSNIGSDESGTLWLYYGSKNIPVHLNPQFSDVKSIPQENGAGITFAPNPAQLWSVATIVWPVSEDGQYSIYDMLGRKLEHGPIQLYGGAEQQRIYFSGMPAGVYIYTIEGAHGSATRGS